MDRFAIAACLREIADLLGATGDPGYRSGAYQRGAQTIEQYAGDLDGLIAARRLQDLPGVGPSVAAAIEDLHRTGTTPRLEELRAAFPRGYRELRRVPGLGPKRVLALHAALGIEDLDDLVEAAQLGRLQQVPGFSAAAEAKLLAAALAAQERPRRVLLHHAVAAAEPLVRWLAEAPGVERVHVAGDVRRSVETVDRLDLVAVGDPGAVAERFVAWPGFVRTERHPGGCRGTTSHDLGVVVVVCPPAEEAATLVIATGGAEHVRWLRARGPLEGRDESEVYANLGLPLVPPELREGPIDGDLGDLLEVGDVQGLVHCHTTWSDGKASIEEMARAAEARGARYLTITDHSATASYANGLDADRLKAQWDEIDRVQERVSVRLLKGTESDILADGALDFPDAVLERLDVVIASIHARHGMSGERMTERVVRAMRHPCFKIWGHALGRLLERRPPIDVDVERILDVIAVERAAVEINGDPYRLDLPPKWIPAARARRIPLVVSVDAHSVAGLDALRWGVAMARRGGVRKHEVLNASGADAFAAAVRPTGG